MKLTDISRQLATAFAAVGVSSLVLVGCNNSSAPEATKEPVTEGSTAETAAPTQGVSRPAGRQAHRPQPEKPSLRAKNAPQPGQGPENLAMG